MARKVWLQSAGSEAEASCLKQRGSRENGSEVSGYRKPQSPSSVVESKALPPQTSISPQRMMSTGDQVFKYKNLVGIFLIQNTTGLSHFSPVSFHCQI